MEKLRIVLWEHPNLPGILDTIQNNHEVVGVPPQTNLQVVDRN
jgi:hypothetical protein